MAAFSKFALGNIKVMRNEYTHFVKNVTEEHKIYHLHDYIHSKTHIKFILMHKITISINFTIKPPPQFLNNFELISYSTPNTPPH